MINEILERKINEIDKTNIESMGLMGSYSRGEAKKYSDVDIVCILKKDAGKKSTLIEIIEDKYVVTSFTSIEEMEECFTEPEGATENILGLQQVKILYDPNNTFNNLRLRGMKFQWTKEMQRKADEIAGRWMVGLIEEVHKALQGLLSNDVGRMLNGLFGLTHGLFNVVRVQKGILLNGENSFYNRIVGHDGVDSRFAMFSEKAFGIGESSGIRERTAAGLLLFDEVSDELMNVMREEDKQAVILAKEEIHRELGNMDIGVKLHKGRDV